MQYLVLLQNSYADSRFLIIQEKLDNEKKKWICTQMDLIIPSPPLAHFISLKVHIHNINSVGKEVKEYESCGQNN